MKPGLTHHHAEHTMQMGHAIPSKTTATHMGHDRHAGTLGGHVPGQILADSDPHTPRRRVVGRGSALGSATAPTFPGSQYIPAFLGTIVFLYGGSVFIRGARENSLTAGRG